MVRTVALVLASLTVASACGDDSVDVASRDEYVDAVTEGVEVSDEAGVLDRETAQCIAVAVVDGIGVERLHDIGLSPQDVSGGADIAASDVDEETAAAVADEALACLDLGAMVVAELPEGLLSEQSRACLDERLLGSETLRDVLVGEMLGTASEVEADPSTEIAAIVGDCLSAQERESLGE